MLAFSVLSIPGNYLKANTIDIAAFEKPVSNTDTVLLNLKFRLDSISFHTIEF